LEFIEELFSRSKTAIDSIIEENHFHLSEKDSKLGITTYEKYQGANHYYLWTTFKQGKLVYLVWEEHLFLLTYFIQRDILSGYNFDEDKSDEDAGLLYYKSQSKPFELQLKQMIDKNLFSVLLIKK
jgi:hypothetical protein